ncbi:dUTP diphosphatase [Hazenella sp. IB182357]|uniref:Deoxyuridine 5'-triphosphate nucleotidohydrolase n=1 Tax=Polycladospora coralii TaxID=2771432 RepID=A0A926N9F6_9BACL|nr:dUTP diphosphatase [Polycladospora coralii]MBD1371832.1 dUTP diphosphatase [Polycladospora coralii]MBS7529293.1 dUTP diphosphatase [Polycladospora coralii]
MQIQVQIKKIDEEAVIPQYATRGSAGFDLVAHADRIILPGETKLISTGLAFAIPAGYEMQIRPRSGISLKTKLRLPNSPGTIDSDYRGELYVMMENGNVPTGNSGSPLDVSHQPIEGTERYPEGTYIIRRGDRIAQGVIAQVEQAQFVAVKQLDETIRGTGGFGHTGTAVID